MGCGAVKQAPVTPVKCGVGKDESVSFNKVVPVHEDRGAHSSSGGHHSHGGAKSSSADPPPPLQTPQEPDSEPGVNFEPPESKPPPKHGHGSSGGGAGGRKANQRKRIQRAENPKDGEAGEADAGEVKSNISTENRKFLNKVLQKHFLFSALEDDERNVLIDYMEPQSPESGQTIFSQGQKGDCLFVIQNGTFTVSIDDRPLKQLKAKHTFGELALLYNVKRTAGVSCTQAGVLWRLGERRFRQCMERLSGKHLSKVRGFLDTDSTFSTLKEEERDTLAAACSVQSFQRGDQILREGEVGDWMFIIIEGNVLTVDQYGNSVVKQPGTILGSAGLMYTKKQIFGAKAIDHVTCLALGKSALERLIGPVEHVLRRSAIKSLVLDNAGSRSGELDFFTQLLPEQQNAMIDNFEDVSFEEGEVLISQGAKAQFIIIIDGEVALSDKEGAGGGVGGVSLRDFAKEVLTSGMSYGGKAIVNDLDMQDSAIALCHCRVHRVGCSTLVKVFGEPLHEVIRLNEIKKVLSDVFLFKNLAEDQIDRTVRCLERRRYAAGEVIVKQGDAANDFFLIHSGVICVSKDGNKLRTLGRWDYFGERGLLLQDKRSATCQAENSTVCLVLDAETFRDIVGMFRRDLEHRMYLQDLDITMSDLRLVAVVGRGTFGIVKLVHHRSDSSKVYALKCVDKGQVQRQRQEKALVIERDINAQCYHPCIVQFIKTFQDDTNVYFLTEFLGGGDLFYAIREIGNLTREQAQFYSASIMLGLEYLHGRGIMYRDLKPENVLLDFDGNAKLVDFGCCKKALRTSTLVGTPEYLAPEVILGKGYTCAVDWWALGVMMHEFIVGPLPFGRDTEDQLELFREILEAPLSFPQYVSDDNSVSIVSGLLERSPELRIGSSTRGAKEIEEHRYFSDFPWKELASHYMVTPWQPDTEKLKSNWEMMKKEPLSLLQEPYVPSTEPSMEWALTF